MSILAARNVLRAEIHQSFDSEGPLSSSLPNNPGSVFNNRIVRSIGWRFGQDPNAQKQKLNRKAPLLDTTGRHCKRRREHVHVQTISIKAPVQHLEGLFHTGIARDLSDCELLDRFLTAEMKREKRRSLRWSNVMGQWFLGCAGRA